MKAFLEDLEQLLIKHKVSICADDRDSKVAFWHANNNGVHPTSKHSILTSADIQRFKRKLEAES